MPSSPRSRDTARPQGQSRSRFSFQLDRARVCVGALLALGCSMDLPEARDGNEPTFDAAPDVQPDGPVEAGPDAEPDAEPDSPLDVKWDGPPDADTAPCGPGYKLCGEQCVPADDPAYGCASATCQSCELSNASAKCSGGVCSISQCTPGWTDCDGQAGTGCEADLESDARNCGQCGYDCLESGCSDGHCELTPIATGIPACWAIALDDTFAYVTAGLGEHDLMRVLKSGGTPEFLTTLPGGEGAVAVDATHVYWANAGSGDVNRVPKAGGTVELLGSSSEPLGLALDADNVFWTDSTDGTVMQVPKTLAAPPTILASGIDDARLLTLDAENLYVVGSNGDAFRASLAGGGATQIGMGSTGLWSGWGIAVDTDWAYWVSVPSLYKVPKTGGTQVEMATGFNSVRFLTLDAGRLFICSSGPDNRLTTIATSGSTSLQSLGSVHGCHGIAVDEDYVYVTRWENLGVPEGGLYRVARPPSSP